MRCLSHFSLFGNEKCMKGQYEFMRKTRICYFCARELKKLYGISQNQLLKDNFYKNFTSTDKGFSQTTHNFLLNNKKILP
jgi:hypothetical protein